LINWLLKSKPVGEDDRIMRTNWTSRFGRRFGSLFTSPLPEGYFSGYFGDADRDADGRRIRSELDAIRVHFPDHA
jgi:hypothetical protein